jgi:hypothetical protein
MDTFRHTVKTLEATLRGMPPDAPILVRVGDALRRVSLVRPAWVAGGNEVVRPSSSGP